MHVSTAFLVYPLIFANLFRESLSSPLRPSVPRRILALAGSCVVIPCSFTPATPQSLKGWNKWVDVRVKFRGDRHLFSWRHVAFNSEDMDQVNRDFQGRMSLIGGIESGDCSLKMEMITLDDQRVFDIALKTEGQSAWGPSRSVILDVVETPEAPVISGVSSATEGQLVTLNCSVSYSCPSQPPVLQWMWDRSIRPSSPQQEHTFRPEAHRLVLQASLTFTVLQQVKATLRCAATFPGDETVVALKDLHVTFPPRDVKVHVLTRTMQEGGTALLVCSCKADPPVMGYRWSYSQHGQIVHIYQRTYSVQLHNITRDMSVTCSAQNQIGRGESQPMLLNIEYKPTILQPASTCVLKDMEVFCRCLVSSNPSPSVSWHINGTALPDGYNTSVESEAGTLIISLRGHMNRPETVTCFASNPLGNDSVTLFLEGEESELLWWLVALGLIICVVLLLFTMIFCCWRKRSQKLVLTRRPAVYPERMGIYQERMPLYINCTEVTHVYANGSYQLVYQNCTPFFVRHKQIRPVGRRGGERRLRGRRRGGEGGGLNRQVQRIREVQETTATETEIGIYLEVF